MRRVDAHLGTMGHRSVFVEFRLEQHLEALKARLGLVGLAPRRTPQRGAGEETEAPANMDLQAGEDLPEWARRDSNARPLAPEASALSN